MTDSDTAAFESRLPALNRWMQGHVPDFSGPLRIEPFAGGQSNPTYRLFAASGDYVLRRRPMGHLLPSAHQIDREYRVQRALAGSGVPVVRMYDYCDDAAVIGSAFFVMDYIPGRIFYDQRLPGLDPTQRRAMFDAMNEVIAALHQVDWRAAGLEGFGRVGGFLGRQIARWTKQYRASETTPVPEMDRLIDWLPANMPGADEVSLVHGDYRMDNLIFHPTEPRVLAVLDWELSTIGDPLADLGYHASSWRIAPEVFRGLRGIDFAALGIPDEQFYIAAYCRRTGRAGIPRWDFYVIYGMFRIAAILQGVLKRALDGIGASRDGVEVGRQGTVIARDAWSLAQQLGGRNA